MAYWNCIEIRRTLRRCGNNEKGTESLSDFMVDIDFSCEYTASRHLRYWNIYMEIFHLFEVMCSVRTHTALLSVGNRIFDNLWYRSVAATIAFPEPPVNVRLIYNSRLFFASIGIGHVDVDITRIFGHRWLYLVTHQARPFGSVHKSDSCIYENLMISAQRPHNGDFVENDVRTYTSIVSADVCINHHLPTTNTHITIRHNQRTNDTTRSEAYVLLHSFRTLTINPVQMRVPANCCDFDFTCVAILKWKDS